MALEVNFYAGTRELYDSEPERDAGGLYALIDGLGVYRGNNPVAGPAPIDITCRIQKEIIKQNNVVYTGAYTCKEHIDTIFGVFDYIHGYGSRPLRVSGITADGRELLLFNSKKREDGALEFVQAEVAEQIPEDEDIDSVSCIIYKIIITHDYSFTLIKISGRLSVSNISSRNLDDRLTDVEQYIVAISNHAVIRHIVEALPTENIDLNTIYMIHDAENNVYVEWMYINGAWKQIGTTDVSLADYVPYTVYNELVEKVETLEAAVSWTTLE